MPLPKKLLPYLALLFGILALSFSALFVRWAEAPGPVTALFRIGLATLIMTPFVLLRRRNRPAHAVGLAAGPAAPAALQSAPPPARVPVTAVAVSIALLGGLMTAGDHAIWSTALGYTSAANATLLNNTAPLWVSLFAWLIFRERLNGRFWAGLGLTLAGATAVLGLDFLQHPTLGWGDLLAVASGLFYAGYFLVTQRGRQDLDTLTYSWLVGLGATAALLVICLLSGFPLSGYSPLTYLTFLGAAVISHLGGYLSVGYALGHLPASLVSPTMIGQPALTALLAVPLLGEGLRPVQVIGGLAVLFGIFLIHTRHAGAKPADPVETQNLASLQT